MPDIKYQYELTTRMHGIRRFTTCKTVYPQTVTEHSMNVVNLYMLFMHQFRKECRYSYSLMIAIIRHDFPEVFSNDIPYTFKRQIPGLKEELLKAEKNCLAETEMPDVEIDLHIWNKRLLEMLDMLELLHYTSNEIISGNQDVWIHRANRKATKVLSGYLSAKVSDNLRVLIAGKQSEIQEFYLQHSHYWDEVFGTKAISSAEKELVLEGGFPDVSAE